MSGASWVAQWSKALHCSASCATRDSGFHGATHNWPSVVWVWPVGISLSHRALVTPIAGRAQCTLTGLDARCVKKQCGWVGLSFGGLMALDLRLSRARTGVVAMRQDH